MIADKQEARYFSFEARQKQNARSRELKEQLLVRCEISARHLQRENVPFRRESIGKIGMSKRDGAGEMNWLAPPPNEPRKREPYEANDVVWFPLRCRLNGGTSDFHLVAMNVTSAQETDFTHDGPNLENCFSDGAQRLAFQSVKAAR